MDDKLKDELNEKFIEELLKSNDTIDEVWECPDCGWEGTPKSYKSMEDTDADGNRGRLVTWIICPECEWEQGYL